MTTPKFEEALGYAARLHAAQIRKGSAIPYADTKLVSGADKLDNARDILRGLKAHGSEIWNRFQGKHELEKTVGALEAGA